METTGLFPSADRVVELAVVQLDPDARITGEFCTLIDPRRDVGPTSIHGIKAADVIGAPVFADAAGPVWQLLAGRILVAHNARFDALFLDAEFRRCGVRLPPPPVMCTMELAGYYLRGLPARSLPSCCRAAGVALQEHHSAIDDARAAAGLMAFFRAAHGDLPGSWSQALIAAGQCAWLPEPAGAGFWPVTRADQVLRRSRQRPPLADLVDRLPRGPAGHADAYLALLDSVLEDRMITSAELVQLTRLAAEFGLTQSAAQQAHREYVGYVAAAAWRDRTVTDAERDDLLEVARLLGVPAEEALGILQGMRGSATQPARQQARLLHAGDRVVFTGDMQMNRAGIEALATAAGLRVTTSVSSKTALVVAADPHSQSGKASTARKLGVRLVTEQVFLDLLDSVHPTADATTSALA